MKVLYVGSTSGTATSLHYFTSLVRLGHQAFPFDPGYFMTSDPLQRLRVRLHRGPLDAKIKQVGEKLVALCLANHFDLVFVMGENFVTPETIAEIRNKPNPPRFVFHSHDNLFFAGICTPPDVAAMLKGYDLVFTTKSQHVARYRELGVASPHFLPSAYEPSVHHPIKSSESRTVGEWGATFVGTYDRSREKWLSATGWERLHVWGSSWDRYDDLAAKRDRIVTRPLYYFEFADVICHSRIALGLLREEAEDLHTTRTIEIPACGGLQFAPRNSEIQSFFEEGKEIVLFDTTEELKSKVDYYWDRESERKRIALAGMERCLNSGHRYQDRVEEILRLTF